MRAQQLSPPQRRLLRLVGNAEPRPVRTMPGEARAARDLEEMGLVRLEIPYGGQYPDAVITEQGRRALS